MVTYPKAYIQYLVYFHGLRDYFKCHEVLEEYWKKDDKDNRKEYLVGLIQIAVSLYHQRRGNFKGAEKMMKSALKMITLEQKSIETLSIDYHLLLSLLTKRYREIINKKNYTSINLPIVSNELIEICKKECQKLNCTRGSESDLKNSALIHKHRLRNRTEIINEREKQKNKRS